MNDDVRSPGSGSTPGPLSAQPPPGLGDPDPGKFNLKPFFFLFRLWTNQSIKSGALHRLPTRIEMISNKKFND